MGKVIRMPERKAIPPKTINGMHAGQRYTVVFDSNAPITERWTWIVDYTRVYRMYGACPTAEAAGAQARKRIHRMTQRQHMEEESE